MNRPFKFKQFTIHQDQCAMKVGTDDVLLGAWKSLEGNPTSILDIGAGTGRITLQLAQCSNAMTMWPLNWITMPMNNVFRILKANQ